MIKEITMTEFEEKFPEVNTYSWWSNAKYLEDGTILLETDWNGKEYIINGKLYKPFYDFDIITDQRRVLGYVEWGEVL